ncbi:MAG: outer membrane protein [Hyphomicrobiales bacterium]
MRRLTLASTGILAMAAGLLPASAADIQRRAPMPTKAPAYYQQAYNWTGAYVGINGGYGWGNTGVSAPFPGSFNLNGGLIGGTLGYNWQAGPAVFGLETDLDWTNIKGNGACDGTTCQVRNSWLGTTRGRLGFAADRFMPFVSGGLAYGNIRNTVAGVGDNSITKAGWTLGGGVEAALAGPWTAKVEYLYVDLGRGGTVAGSDASFQTNIVRAGVNYRF